MAEPGLASSSRSNATSAPEDAAPPPQHEDSAPPNPLPSQHEDSAPSPQHDWEVLSMSMSASTFGTPGSASVVCSCDTCTGQNSVDGVPHHSLSHQELAPEVSLLSAVNQTGSGEQVSAAAMFLEVVGPSNVESQSDLVQQGIPDDSSKTIIATEASGSGYSFKNWTESLSAGGSGDLGSNDDGNRMVSASDIEPFTEGWKPRHGTAAALDAVPGVFGAFHDIADVEHNSFQGDFQEGTVLPGHICSANEETEPLVGLQNEMFMPGEEFVITEEIAGERIIDPVSVDKVSKKKARKGQSSEAWWKRQTAMWRVQSRKSSAMWSIALAATVLGIVIVGQRWQRERCQNQQLRLELCAKDEKINDLMDQFSRLKDAMTGRRRVPVMRSSGYSRFSDH